MGRATQLASQGRPARTTSFDPVAALGANGVTPAGWTGNFDIYAAFTLSLVWLTSTCGIKAFSHAAPTPSAGFGVRRGDLAWGYDDGVVRSASWEPHIDRQLGNESCSYCKLRGMQVGWAVSEQGEGLQEPQIHFMILNPIQLTFNCSYSFWIIFFFNTSG